MNDNKLIDLFGELELGTFENDIMERELWSPWKRVKKMFSNNVKKIIAITTAVTAGIACVTGIVILIIKYSKKSVRVA